MKAIQKITAIFLAIVFLFSSFGFTISSMVCIKSGKGKVSFATIEECCYKNTETAAKITKTACCDDEKEFQLSEPVATIQKGECCDITNFTYKLNDFQNAQQLFIGQPTVVNTIFLSSDLSPIFSSENKLSFYASDLPPPFGRNLLNFISILII